MTGNDQNTILVVDDEHSHMMAIVKCFENRYQVLYATNGKEGYEIALEASPDIIIMDWNMPVMNGIDTILKLKSKDTTQNIPVLMATGVMTTPEDLKSALEAGAIDFIRKPFDELELMSRTQAALRLSQSHKKIQQLMLKEKELLEKQLGQKERELTLQAIQMQEREQFLNDITGQIGRLGNMLDGVEAKLLAGIKKNLHNHIDTDRAWTNFLVHFESVHPNFFGGLKRDYPSLTNNELRLCGYIKIGMDNKEMAQVAGIGIGTIKSNLNRLKKKMSLEANDSIRNFIINYKGDVAGLVSL